MPDLIKTLLDLSDIIIKYFLRMIPPLVAIVSLLVAYYYYKINENKENFKINKKNYFFNKGCKKKNNKCMFQLNKKFLKCPEWICEKEKFKNYYCFDGKKCDKNKTNNNIIKNTCGYNQISYTPNKIYTSKDECLKNLDYQKYNKKECVNKSRFLGWYVDSKGNGKCVKGSPMGPNKITLDYKIYGGLTKKNTFQIGNPNPYIL